MPGFDVGVFPLHCVVNVDFGHVQVDVVVDLGVLEDHHDLPLLPHLVEQGDVQICKEGFLALVLDRQIQDNPFDLVELFEHHPCILELICVIHFLDFALSPLLKIACLHRVYFRMLSNKVIICEALQRHDLTKDQELNISGYGKLLGEVADDLRGQRGSDLEAAVLQEGLDDAADRLVRHLRNLVLNYDLFQLRSRSEIVDPEVTHVGDEISSQNHEAERNKQDVVQELVLETRLLVHSCNLIKDADYPGDGNQ